MTKYKADEIAKKNPKWKNIDDGLPEKGRFVRWLSSDGIIVYRALVSMTDTDCVGRNARSKFKLLYWRPLKIIKETNNEK